MFHLDTNIVIEWLRGNAVVAQRIKSALPEVAISSIVLAELAYGAAASARPEHNSAMLRKHVEAMTVVGFDVQCAETYGHLAASLRRLGRLSGEVDVLIAAVAVVHGAILVTHDKQHFSAMTGLRTEDWVADFS